MIAQSFFLASLGISKSLLLQILLAVAILAYFLLRKRGLPPRRSEAIQRREIKLLCGMFVPREVRVAPGQIVHLVIHRLDGEPKEELFEIESQEVCELLPAYHATIIAFTPKSKGKCAMLLGGDREAGVFVVE